MDRAMVNKIISSFQLKVSGSDVRGHQLSRPLRRAQHEVADLGWAGILRMVIPQFFFRTVRELPIIKQPQYINCSNSRA
jgi:hypothetical protein